MGRPRAAWRKYRPGAGSPGEEPRAAGLGAAAGPAGPGARLGPFVKTRAWAAPRTAYLLTAAMADNSGQAGVIAATDAMSDEWSGYSVAEQREVLIALGAQARVSLQLLREKLGMQIEMDWDEVARVVCAEALLLARELVSSGEVPRVMPECAHCREVIGNGLCSLQIQAYFMLGFTPGMIAETCRRSAEEVGHVGEPVPASAR